jgi:hypothetical protein
MRCPWLNVCARGAVVRGGRSKRRFVTRRRRGRRLQRVHNEHPALEGSCWSRKQLLVSLQPKFAARMYIHAIVGFYISNFKYLKRSWQCKLPKKIPKFLWQ